MQPWKKTVFSFLVGGVLAVLAQAILVIWQNLLVDTPMSFFMGGATLVSMGVIGFLLGGFAIYQLLGEWADFGSFLPFSGFSMAVGMKAVGPWTKGEGLGKCVWNMAWLVIWFNAVGAIVCILFGYICQMTGLNADPIFVSEKNTTATIFPLAFLMGGILCAIFQIVWEIEKKALPGKAKHVHILMFAWMMGAVFAPCGLSGMLSNVCGEGFAVMIPIGGLNMYNVGVDLAIGGEHTAEGLLHLGSFLLAVCGLFLCGCCTFIIYNARYGRRPINEVHAEMGKMLYERKSGKQIPAESVSDAAGTSVKNQS